MLAATAMADGAEHMRSRRMQLPPFHGEALVKHQAVMERKTEETLERWPYGRATRAETHMQAISLEVIMAVVFASPTPTESSAFARRRSR